MWDIFCERFPSWMGIQHNNGKVKCEAGRSTQEKQDDPKSALIKNNLKKAFDEKAGEDLPADLMALIAKLRDQDVQNGK